MRCGGAGQLVHTHGGLIWHPKYILALECPVPLVEVGVAAEVPAAAGLLLVGVAAAAGRFLIGSLPAGVDMPRPRAQSVDTLPLWCGPSGSTQVESVGSARYAQCTGTLSVDPWTSLEWTVRASGPPLSGQWKQWNAVNREITSKAPLRAHKSHKIAQRG